MSSLRLNQPKVKLSFSSSEISSCGGIFFYAQFLENIGLPKLLERNLYLSNYSWQSHPAPRLVIQKILSLLAGYEDNIDSQIIKHDPVFRLSLKDKIGSQPTLSRLENSANLETIRGFYQLNLELLAQAWQREGRKKLITLDLDATDDSCYGKQKGASYHGYYQAVIYHPLFLFDGESGDLIKGMLRQGSCSDFHKVIAFLEPVIDFFQKRGYKIKLRADAGMNSPQLYHWLEQKGVDYVIKLRRNEILDKKALELLPLERGWRKKKDSSDKIKFTSFSYQAESWSRARQVYLKQVHPSSQLFPEYHFLLSNIQEKPEKIFAFYGQRGRAENYLKEGKLDLSFTKLSCSSFWANAFRLQVAILVYNINNLFRRFILPPPLKVNFLSTLRWKIVKLGCCIIRHAREIICRFGSNFKQEKLVQWIISRLQLFKLSWT